MIEELLINGICAFIGSAAFGILFNIPKHYYVGCGITGAAGWCIYLILDKYIGVSTSISSFFGTLVVVLIARMLTVRMKCPITIFLVPGVIPMVPGAILYHTTYYLVVNELGMAATKGLEAVKVSFGIVLGIAIVLSIPRDVFQKGYWKQWKYHRKKKDKTKSNKIII